MIFFFFWSTGYTDIENYIASILKNEEGSLSKPIVTGLINVFCKARPEGSFILLLNIFNKLVLLYSKKQMSKETFDMINEQSQRKS